MPRKRYEYKNIENVNTLRLSVDFGKLQPVNIVEEAYYILATKNKKKSAYILEALAHSKEDTEKSVEMKRAMQRFRIAHQTKLLFNIGTREDAEKLLSLEEDSIYYKKLLASIPEYKKPTKMLCGFNMYNTDAVNAHTKLFALSANERVLAISNAVVDYVLDGMDPEMDRIFAVRFLLSSIKEYQHSLNKDKTLDNFMLAINFIK